MNGFRLSGSSVQPLSRTILSPVVGVGDASAPARRGAAAPAPRPARRAASPPGSRGGRWSRVEKPWRPLLPCLIWRSSPRPPDAPVSTSCRRRIAGVYERRGAVSPPTDRRKSAASLHCQRTEILRRLLLGPIRLELRAHGDRPVLAQVVAECVRGPRDRRPAPPRAALLPRRTVRGRPARSSAGG